jgi:hypothetical protein
MCVCVCVCVCVGPNKLQKQMPNEPSKLEIVASPVIEFTRD